jgi:rSAM/selenodomain-associated transferase 1
MFSNSALVVMARYPAVGEVKTRLGRSIGAARACALYRAFLDDIEARFAGQRRALVWAFYPPDRDFAATVGPGGRCLPQEGRDLGERLHNCFRRLCGEGFERVLIIGGDAPHVRDEWLDEAEARLDDTDVVLGPSADGGYYLIAMRRPLDVFSGIEMSTERVLAETLDKAKAAGLRVHLLPRSFDVDEEGDLVRLQELLRADGCASWLPATAAVLRDWRR